MNGSGLRPLRVGEILDVAIKVYRAHFIDLVKVVATVVAPVYVLGALVQLSVEPEDFNTTNEFGESTFDATEFWTFFAATLIVGLLGMVAAQLATAAALKIVGSAYLAAPSDWRTSLAFATGRLRSVLWLMIVQAVLLVLLFLACVVPGIYFYAAWSVAVPALVLEDVRGRQALRRSRALVRGRWWPVAGTLLVSFLLVSVVSTVFSQLVTAVVVGDSRSVEAALDAVAQTLSAALTTPFSAAVLTVLYVDLRVRKEGLDLELLASQVGVTPSPEALAAADAAEYRAGDRHADGGDEPPFWPPPPGWRPRA